MKWRWPNAWSFIIKSQTSSFIGKPIIPPDISNLGIYLNLDIGKVEGIYIEIPKKLTIKTLNGARWNILTFQFDELSVRQKSAIFSMAANGTSFEEFFTAEAKVIALETSDEYRGIKIFDLRELKVFHGARQDDLFCEIEDMIQKKSEPHFNVEGNGTFDQESINIKGEIRGATSDDVQIWKFDNFEIEEENQKMLQCNAKKRTER